MICSLLNRELRFLCRRLLRFIHSSISRTMGCFSVCFRARERDRSHRRSPIPAAKPTDVVISRNRLSSLFLAEESVGTEHKDRGRCHSGSPQVRKQLRDEATFVKSRGILPETPEEIRNDSAKLRSLTPNDKTSTPNDKTSTSDFQSWLPNASPKKIGIEKQPERKHTPTKLRDVMANDDDSLDDTYNSCITKTQVTGGSSINSSKCTVDETSHLTNKVHMVQAENVASPSTQYRNKPLQFNSADQIYSSGGDQTEDYKESELLEDQSLRRSINSTPLNLPDDMQTPDTVLPGNLGNLPNRMTRIRSEYVYPIPSDGSHVQLKGQKEDDTKTDHVSLEKTNEDERKSERVSGKYTDEVKVEVGLSEWLKPPVPRHEPRIGKTLGERPIIGLVATHWNENLLTETSPPSKGWDGNGIPNSTNKYKEDQKVSWHATPFEERLEKALSEESFSQRNQVTEGIRVGLHEEDEDTAASKLHRPFPSEPMVSV